VSREKTYPLKRYWRSVSNSSAVTLERYIGFASDLPSTSSFPCGSENMELKMGELREKRHWGTRKRRFSTYTQREEYKNKVKEPDHDGLVTD